MATNTLPQKIISGHKTAALAMILLTGITLAIHIFSTAAYLDRSMALISLPSIIDYGEGPILYQIAALGGGETMYHPIAAPPYTVSNYPPAFHLTAWYMTALVNDPLIAGRLVSFLAGLGSSLLIFTLVYGSLGRDHSLGARAFGGALAALFFLNHCGITLWSVTARVDTLALMLGLLGMQLFVLSIRRRSLAYLFGLAFVLAVFTKQNMIAAAIGTFATAFILDRRQTYIAFAISVLAGLIALSVLHITSDGQFFVHAFQYNLNEFQWNRRGRIVLQALADRPAELLLLLYGPVYLFMRNNTHGDRLNRPDIPLILFSSFMTASLLNVIASVKAGASFNYLLEFEAAGSLLLGVIAVRTTTFLRARGLGPEYAKHRLLIIMGLFILSWQTSLSASIKYEYPHENSVPAMRRVLELAATVNGPIISEDMVLLYKTGKPLYYQPFIMTQLASEGQWNPAPLINSLRRGDVTMIILTSEIGSTTHQGRFFAAFTEAVQTRYRLLEKTGPYMVYIPL